MNTLALVRSQIEARYPSAFTVHRRFEPEYLPTGIPAIDGLTHGGIPLNSLTEICGSSVASSGKTTAFVSLLAHATRKGQFCALVDASDCFDLSSAEASGVALSHLLWVRCGTTPQKYSRLTQALKITDLLLQRSGFSVIVVDLSRIPEKFIRRIPMVDWFRYSRVVENLPTALVFIEQRPHATSCAGLVLKLRTESSNMSGKLFTNFKLKAEVLRTREKKGIQSVTQDFSIRTQWA
jgi:hypothetical protein